MSIQIKYLENLTGEELDFLLQSLPLITILIGAVEDDLTDQEVSYGEKIVHIRSYNEKELLLEFYEQAEKTFVYHIQNLVAELPKDPASRNAEISVRLEKLNDILAKLDQRVAGYLYKGLVSFAHHIARAEGGVLGFFSISKAEEAWINLPMLTPISIFEEDEDSEEQDEEA